MINFGALTLNLKTFGSILVVGRARIKIIPVSAILTYANETRKAEVSFFFSSGFCISFWQLSRLITL